MTTSKPDPYRNPRRIPLATLAAACALVAAPAHARVCYTIYDAKDTIVYRDWTAPFDGAVDFGSPGREALRTRGEHLVWFEAEHCAPVSGTATGTSGGRPATADEIVAGLQTYSRPSAGITGVGGRPGVAAASPAASSSGAGGPATRIVAPATSAMQARSASYR